MLPIKVEVSRRLLDRFKRAAKAAFPCETFAYLIGQNAGSLQIVEDLYFPEGVERNCTTNAVWSEEHWLAEATTYARDEDAAVIGDIHSHPRTFARWGGQLSECTPSAGDHAIGWHGLCGICVVSEQQDGRLKAAARFYGPSPQIETHLL